MLEGAAYLLSSFWLGAVHAATPGHGKTVAAAYLVGTRGRATDAVALGIFVTLAHTGGIVMFGVLATIGSAALSQRSESYVSLGSALLMVGVGAWMAFGYFRNSHHHRHRHHHDHHHEHDFDAFGDQRPSWSVLLGLGLAGGLLPDPAALAVLLSAVASGRLVLGLLTVVVFSVGFASVLVVVGAVVGHAGQISLRWLPDSTLQRLQLGTALLIVLVGTFMTVGAWRQILV